MDKPRLTEYILESRVFASAGKVFAPEAEVVLKERFAPGNYRLTVRYESERARDQPDVIFILQKQDGAPSGRIKLSARKHFSAMVLGMPESLRAAGLSTKLPKQKMQNELSVLKDRMQSWMDINPSNMNFLSSLYLQILANITNDLTARIMSPKLH